MSGAGAQQPQPSLREDPRKEVWPPLPASIPASTVTPIRAGLQIPSRFRLGGNRFKRIRSLRMGRAVQALGAKKFRSQLGGSDDGDRQAVKILAAVPTDGLPAVEAACTGAGRGRPCGGCRPQILANSRSPIAPVMLPGRLGMRAENQATRDQTAIKSPATTSRSTPA